MAGAGSAGAGSPDDLDAPSDADLLEVIRGRAADDASTVAFGILYGRHRDAARSLARQLARSPSDADDLVSAAFARLLEILRAGGGPTEAFRAYLLTSLRHLAYDRTRADRRLDLTEDMGEVIGVDPDRTIVPFADPAVAGLERSLAARAFATLPERWQAVLWHLEVEGDSPADIAPLFGLTPNAVSALGYRAREGLRQAYLQEHLAGGSPDGSTGRRHTETEAKLGAYTRGGLSRRDAAKVEEHLRECAECRALAAELREVNSGIVRSAIGPLVLGAALVGYLASRSSWVEFPSTAEFVVAGGGVVGVLGAVGGLVRTAEVPRSRRVGAAVVGLAGLGVATATMLGGGPAPAPPLAMPLVMPPGPVWTPPAPAPVPPPVPRPAAVPVPVPLPDDEAGPSAGRGSSRSDDDRGGGSGSGSGSRSDDDRDRGSSSDDDRARSRDDGGSSEDSTPDDSTDPIDRELDRRSRIVELRVVERMQALREPERRGLLEPVLDVLLG